MKRITSILLSLVFIFSFTACSNGSSQNANIQGKSEGENTGYTKSDKASDVSGEPFYYDEKDISSSTGLKYPGAGCINSKDQLLIADGTSDSTTRFVILERDGNQAGEIKCGLPGLCRLAAIDAQDNLCVVADEKIKDKDYKQVLYIISPKGEIIKSIDLTKLYGKGEGGLYATDIAAGTDGNIYLVDPMKPVQVLDRSGKLLKTLGSGKYLCIGCDDENNIYMLDMEKSKYYLEKIEAVSGKSVWKKDITADLPSSYNSLEGIKLRYCKGDKGLYLNYNRGLLMYSTDGNFRGNALDYGDYTILADGLPVRDINVDSSCNISITTASDTGFKLFQYTRQKGVKKINKQQKTITISLPYSDPLIDTAASKFNIANPDLKIAVKAAADDEKSYEKYKTVLNTEIMAGKGPDIFSVSGLPYEKYIYRNSLANLSELMEKDKSFDSGILYTNIFDALKYKGDLYVMPTSFLFDSLIVNEKLLAEKSIVIDDNKWTWGDFDSILQKFAKGSGSNKSGNYSVLSGISQVQLLSLIMRGSYGKFIDIENRKSSFTDTGFVQLLNIAKTYGSSGTDKASYKRRLESIMRGTLVFSPEFITSNMGYAILKGMYGKAEISMLKYPSDDITKNGTFTSNSIYAINAKSLNIEGAYEFLKYLLSDEIQTDENMSGFSINKDAQNKRAAAVNETIKSGKAGTFGVGTPGGSSFSYEPKALTAEEINKIDQYISSLGVYSNNDSEIVKIIEDESKAFLSGMKSAEDTSRFIQQRVDTYLGE